MIAPQEKKFLHAILIAGAEYDAVRKLAAAFGSYEAAWRASSAAIARAGFGDEIASRLEHAAGRINPDDTMRQLVTAGIALVTTGDPEFPSLLKEITAPPLALYIKGRLREDLPRLAVVGTRKATPYGREATQKIIRDLAADTDIAVVSGLAQGIDAEAHRAALDAGLATIGVLGGGMDRASFFPPENWNLAEESISKGGAIISEYPPGAPALPHHFPARNRIIAGLSKGTLVVEAPERSGALITARFALEQGRDVFAVPGQLFSPNAAGTHRLIQDGAKLVTRADDIIEELGLPRRARADEITRALTDEAERTILTLLHEPASVDDLMEQTRLTAPEIISRLSLLELKGFIRPMGQNRFQRMM
ncbi:MAG: DNA-processing protein DprA [bacterium]|nr:DNA-processing protein DprA [bacterium]